jgi:hypothetical protein
MWAYLDVFDFRLDPKKSSGSKVWPRSEATRRTDDAA